MVEDRAIPKSRGGREPADTTARDPELMIDRGVSELLERGTIGALLEEGQKESQANIDQLLAKVLLPLV